MFEAERIYGRPRWPKRDRIAPGVYRLDFRVFGVRVTAGWTRDTATGKRLPKVDASWLLSGCNKEEALQFRAARLTEAMTQAAPLSILDRNGSVIATFDTSSTPLLTSGETSRPSVCYTPRNVVIRGLQGVSSLDIHVYTHRSGFVCARLEWSGDIIPPSQLPKQNQEYFRSLKTSIPAALRDLADAIEAGEKESEEARDVP